MKISVQIYLKIYMHLWKKQATLYITLEYIIWNKVGYVWGTEGIAGVPTHLFRKKSGRLVNSL